VKNWIAGRNIFVGFEVFTAVSMKMAVFCLHHQGDRPDDGGSKDL
jgi:hypothetical protein